MLGVEGVWNKGEQLLKGTVFLGRSLFDLSCSNFFLETLPKAREARAKMNYWGFIKIKSFCTPKDNQKTTDRKGEDIHK